MANTYLNRTPSSSGSNTTWTYSCWYKKTSVGLDSVPWATGYTSPQIDESMRHNSSQFKVLHSGFTVVAESAKENPNRTLMDIQNAQLINGAQSQGVLIDLMLAMEADEQPNSTYHNALVSLEIICTSDIELRNEICNSRNTQNSVMLQSRLQ